MWPFLLSLQQDKQELVFFCCRDSQIEVFPSSVLLLPWKVKKQRVAHLVTAARTLQLYSPEKNHWQQGVLLSHDRCCFSPLSWRHHLLCGDLNEAFLQRSAPPWVLKGTTLLKKRKTDCGGGAWRNCAMSKLAWCDVTKGTRSVTTPPTRGFGSTTSQLNIILNIFHFDFLVSSKVLKVDSLFVFSYLEKQSCYIRGRFNIYTVLQHNVLANVFVGGKQ